VSVASTAARRRRRAGEDLCPSPRWLTIPHGGTDPASGSGRDGPPMLGCAPATRAGRSVGIAFFALRLGSARAVVTVAWHEVAVGRRRRCRSVHRRGTVTASFSRALNRRPELQRGPVARCDDRLRARGPLSRPPPSRLVASYSAAAASGRVTRARPQHSPPHLRLPAAAQTPPRSRPWLLRRAGGRLRTCAR
jgi:hypothetical protein